MEQIDTMFSMFSTVLLLVQVIALMTRRHVLHLEVLGNSAVTELKSLG